MAPDAPDAPGRLVVDLATLRRACAPVARWWEDHLASGDADPDALEAALGAARALGPVPGRLGAALGYLVAGCPDLDYASACAAFTHVAAVRRGDAAAPPPRGPAAHQPSLPGLGAPPAPARPASRTSATPDAKGPPT